MNARNTLSRFASGFSVCGVSGKGFLVLLSACLCIAVLYRLGVYNW